MVCLHRNEEAIQDEALQRFWRRCRASLTALHFLERPADGASREPPPLFLPLKTTRTKPLSKDQFLAAECAHQVAAKTMERALLFCKLSFNPAFSNVRASVLRVLCEVAARICRDCLA